MHTRPARRHHITVNSCATIRNVPDAVVVLSRSASDAESDDVVPDDTISASDIINCVDPRERARAATARITALLAEVTALGEARRAAILTMRAGMSQRQVARELNLSQSRVNQIERGKATRAEA